MDKKLLNLFPKRYHCPHCGQWHDWKLSHELGYYDSSSNKACLECENEILKENRLGQTFFYFEDGYCYYGTEFKCNPAKLKINNKISIGEILESSREPRVTFSVDCHKRERFDRTECLIECHFVNQCLILNRCAKDENKVTIEFGFEFDQSDYERFLKPAILSHKIAKSQKEQGSQMSQVNENKEDTIMENNNVLNMNLEFGISKDDNIASTLMGVAVKNGNSWRIYDKKKKEITDVGNMELGKFPIFILPTSKLSEGDLIKDGGEYYFVTKVATAKTLTQTLSARTGEMKSVVPIKNILGFSCYSKVIALSDSFNTESDFDIEKLAIMSAMCGQTGNNGNQMNQLLPLMLFKDKLGGEDDTMKMLLMSSMMNSEDDSNQMNQLLPLMLFKGELGGDDDMMKMLLMSSMMGGNMSDSNNPMMSYLMLDKLMDKKDDETKDDEKKDDEKKDDETDS